MQTSVARDYWRCLPTGEEGAEAPRVSERGLRRFAARALRAAGMAAEDADASAACLVLADLRGVGGHGVFRLLQYTDSMAAGEINLQPRVRVVRQDGATALIDADGGYGYRPALEGMDLAVELASRHGIGCVGIRNSHHFGMAATFVLRAAEAGAVAFVTTNSLPQLASPGGSRAVVGNNPYAFAIPRPGRRRPLVVDIALTEAHFGVAGVAAAQGTLLPPGLALDEQGLPTTDPAAALASGMLVAIGRQKGYGLSVAAEVLAAALTGSPVGLDSHCHRKPAGGVGHLLIAIRPDGFVERPLFDAAVEMLCSQIRSVPPAPGADGVYLPGELGWRTYERRRREGIPLPPPLVDALQDLAGRLGVPRLRAA